MISKDRKQPIRDPPKPGTESRAPKRGLGYAAGALLLTLFGALWASSAAFVLGPRERAVLLSVVAIVGVALTAASVRLLRAAARLPADASEEARRRGRTRGRRFSAVFAVEFAAIALASGLLGTAGLDRFIPPVTALLVGVHFLPLGAVFGMGLYYLTGALITLVATIAVAAPLLGVTLGGAFAWSVAVGLATAAILWATALAVLSIAWEAGAVGES